MSRAACRTLREYSRAALGERDLAPGVIVCVQACGSLAHAHPHLHVLVTDGGDRGDGTFVAAPAHDAVGLEEAAQAMLGWPHAGFGSHVGPRIAADDRAGLPGVARYATRPPVPRQNPVPGAGCVNRGHGVAATASDASRSRRLGRRDVWA